MVVVRGPQPRIHPIAMMAIFSFLISVCSGPAYNSNAFRGFMRESGFLSGAEEEEILLEESSKIFQSVDITFGGIVGIIYGYVGPRISHTFGYICFAAGVLLMASWKTLWYGMFLQGIASVFLLNTVLHLANLFEYRSRLAISFLASVVELSQFIFILMRLGLFIGIPAQVLLWILASIPILGIILTIQLFPDDPFYPRSEKSIAAIMAESREPSLTEEAIITGVRADERDQWGTSESVNTFGTKSTHGSIPQKEDDRDMEASSLLLKERHHRLSKLSISVVALSKSTGSIKARLKKFFASQILSPEFLLITLIFVFFVFRANLYLDGNEQILYHMGDANKEYVEKFSYYMLFSVVASLLNAVAIQAVGIIVTGCVVNGCAIGAKNTVEKPDELYCLVLYAETLGLRYFGPLTGVAMAIGGFVNWILGSWVLEFTRINEASQWYSVNWYLVIGGLIAFIPLLLLWYLEHVRPPKKETTSVT